jgi:hypothetical protein
MSNLNDRQSVKNATTRIAEQRAGRGAQFLDRRIPGWTKKIRVRQLDISSCDACVLGQIYTDYVRGLHTLRISSPKTESHLGFLHNIDRRTSNRELTRAWRTEITKRRKK